MRSKDEYLQGCGVVFLTRWNKSISGTKAYKEGPEEILAASYPTRFICLKLTGFGVPPHLPFLALQENLWVRTTG
jgi:hypothetical protein